MIVSLKQLNIGLWTLVNNAGIAMAGEVEFVQLDQYKRSMEVGLNLPFFYRYHTIFLIELISLMLFCMRKRADAKL